MTEKMPIIRFKPTHTQEQLIISTAVRWVYDHHSSNIEKYLVKLLTEQCNITQYSYCVEFSQLYHKLKDMLQFRNTKQQQSFDRQALCQFLCRTIGTQPSYLREDTHPRRRHLFDNAILDLTTQPVISTTEPIVEPIKHIPVQVRLEQKQDRKSIYKDLRELGFSHHEAMNYL